MVDIIQARKEKLNRNLFFLSNYLRIKAALDYISYIQLYYYSYMFNNFSILSFPAWSWNFALDEDLIEIVVSDNVVVL